MSSSRLENRTLLLRIWFDSLSFYLNEYIHIHEEPIGLAKSHAKVITIK